MKKKIEDSFYFITVWLSISIIVLWLFAMTVKAASMLFDK